MSCSVEVLSRRVSAANRGSESVVRKLASVEEHMIPMPLAQLNRLNRYVPWVSK